MKFVSPFAFFAFGFLFRSTGPKCAGCMSTLGRLFYRLRKGILRVLGGGN